MSGTASMENVGRRIAALEQQVSKLRLNQRAGGGDPHSKATDPRRKNFVVDFNGEGIIGADNMKAWNDAVDAYNAGDYDELWVPAGRYNQNGVPKAFRTPVGAGVAESGTTGSLGGWVHGAGDATELVQTGVATTFFTVGTARETFLDFAGTQKDPPFQGASYFEITDFKLSYTVDNIATGRVTVMRASDGRVFCDRVGGLTNGRKIHFAGPGFTKAANGSTNQASGIVPGNDYWISAVHGGAVADPNSFTLSSTAPTDADFNHDADGNQTTVKSTFVGSIVTILQNNVQGSYTCPNTAKIPSALGLPPIVLNNGGHLKVDNIMFAYAPSFIRVGSADLHGTGEPFWPSIVTPTIDPNARTISAVNTSTFTLTTAAAHGLSVDDPIVFVDDAATLPGNIVAGLDTGADAGYARYLVETTPSATTFTLKNRQDPFRGATHNINVVHTGGHFYTGSYDARVQRYEVSNCLGSINDGVVGTDKIDISNATSGHFSNIQIQAHDFSGGNVVFCHPPGSPGASNNDQHWFTDVHLQGGARNWIEVDVTYGACYNWTLKGCVLDGATNSTVYLHSSDGGTQNTITDFWLKDCHCSSRSGIPIQINKNDAGAWRNIEISGGRYKFSDDTVISVLGSDTVSILGLLFEGCGFLHDYVSVQGALTASNELFTSANVDGTGHDLRAGDEISFSTVTGLTPLIANHSYWVKEVIDQTHFTLATTSALTTTVDITAGGGSGTLRGVLQVAARVDGVTDFRMHDCLFTGFGGAYMEINNAISCTNCVGLLIHDNIADGLRTNTFSVGQADAPTNIHGPFIHHNIVNPV